MFRFDKFLEPVVVVSHTRKNYFNWALSDRAIKANVWVLTFGPPCIYIRVVYYIRVTNIDRLTILNVIIVRFSHAHRTKLCYQ